MLFILFSSAFELDYLVYPGEPILYIKGFGNITQSDVAANCIISEIEEINIDGNISEIGSSSFRDFQLLRTINFICDTIKSIGSYSFAGCLSLKEIQLADSIEIIGYRIFTECPNLEKIIFPRNLKSLDNYGLMLYSDKVYKFELNHGTNFWVDSSKTILINNVTAIISVQNVSKIVIPKEVQILSANFMFEHRLIKEVVFENDSTLNTVMNQAFIQTNIERILFPCGLKHIKSDPFAKSFELQYVFIPASVEKIQKLFSVLPKVVEIEKGSKLLSVDSNGLIYTDSGKTLLYFPPNLTSLTISANITSFEGILLRCAPLLKKLIVEGENEKYSSYENLFFNKNQTDLLGCPGGIREVNNMPSNCTSINSFSFSGTNVEKIVFGENIVNVKGAALSSTRKLKTVILSPKLETIAAWAFLNSSLEGLDIKLPSSLKDIQNNCFSSSSLKSIDFSDCPINIIPNEAFVDCYLLSSVVLPSTLTTISSSAFYGCISLKSVRFPKSLTVLSEKSFMDCISLSEIDFGDCQIPSIPIYCFSNTSVKSVVVPSKVALLDQGCFSDCIELINFTINNECSVEKILPSALSGCTKLEKVNIGKTVSSISPRAFSGADSLVEINVSEDNEWYSSIDNVLFNKNGTILICFPGGLSYCKVNGNVEKFAEYAFYKCINLVRITMSESLPLDSINSFTFSGCSSLLSVVLPRQTSDIFDDAFSGCISLQRVEFVEGSKLEKISSGSFRGCVSLRSVIFGPRCRLRVISDGSFKECRQLRDFKMTENLEEVGVKAFEDCISLESLAFTSSIRTISTDAFRGCTGLHTITYCFSDKSPSNREFSPKAFSDTNIKCVITTANYQELFCGLPTASLMDMDCHIGTLRFTKIAGSYHCDVLLSANSLVLTSVSDDKSFTDLSINE